VGFGFAFSNVNFTQSFVEILQLVQNLKFAHTHKLLAPP